MLVKVIIPSSEAENEIDLTCLQSILATAALATAAAAGATCGKVVYTQAELNSCRSNACAYDNRKGPGGYPHAYSNFEGFKWTVATTSYTLYNYPMGKGGAYNGGK